MNASHLDASFGPPFAVSVLRGRQVYTGAMAVCSRASQWEEALGLFAQTGSGGQWFFGGFLWLGRCPSSSFGVICLWSQLEMGWVQGDFDQATCMIFFGVPFLHLG